MDPDLGQGGRVPSYYKVARPSAFFVLPARRQGCQQSGEVTCTGQKGSRGGLELGWERPGGRSEAVGRGRGLSGAQTQSVVGFTFPSYGSLYFCILSVAPDSS